VRIDGNDIRHFDLDLLGQSLEHSRKRRQKLLSTRTSNWPAQTIRLNRLNRAW
jgi:hypothetical protein